MSISGSQEVKTALVNSGAVTGGSTTVAIDAQEDRVIHGLTVTAEFGDPGRVQGAAECFIGTKSFPADGEANDNRSLHKRFRFDVNDDTTNGPGSQSEATVREEYADFPAGGYEWNEDATLTLEVTESAGNAGFEALLMVDYTER